jgi:hypothetical protein
MEGDEESDRTRLRLRRMVAWANIEMRNVTELREMYNRVYESLHVITTAWKALHESYGAVTGFELYRTRAWYCNTCGEYYPHQRARSPCMEWAPRHQCTENNMAVLPTTTIQRYREWPDLDARIVLAKAAWTNITKQQAEDIYPTVDALTTHIGSELERLQRQFRICVAATKAITMQLSNLGTLQDGCLLGEVNDYFVCPICQYLRTIGPHDCGCISEVVEGDGSDGHSDGDGAETE